MSFYRRRLPHWQPADTALFVIWRLAGSLPANRPFSTGDMTSGQAFVALDRVLDTARSGPIYLRQPEIAVIVMEAIQYAEASLHRYELHAFVIMPNHIHLLITPLTPVPKLLRCLKSLTARRANLVLHREGEPFWQEESYDHWVRDESEFQRIKTYIVQNPVRAGLVHTAEQWPWSSAAAGPGGPAAALASRPTEESKR